MFVGSCTVHTTATVAQFYRHKPIIDWSRDGESNSASLGHMYTYMSDNIYVGTPRLEIELCSFNEPDMFPMTPHVPCDEHCRGTNPRRIIEHGHPKAQPSSVLFNTPAICLQPAAVAGVHQMRLRKFQRAIASRHHTLRGPEYLRSPAPFELRVLARWCCSVECTGATSSRGVMHIEKRAVHFSH